MKFRTVPPDPAEFPRLRLLWPLAMPVLILGVLWFGEWTGHQWNIHGAGALIAVILVASLLVGLVASTSALLSLVPALREHPSLRTPVNMACTALAALFAVSCALYLGVSLVMIVTS